MRFLLDNNLSPQVAEGLAEYGHDATHVRDDGLAAADDRDVLAHATDQNRVLITADTDFGGLLVQQEAKLPSVVLLRTTAARRPTDQLRLLTDNVPALEEDLAEGAMVVIEDTRVRVRSLPL